MTFQLTDIPRLLPELMLLVVALLVLGSDILERWTNEAGEMERRSRAAGELTASMLGLVFIVALVQSKYLFTIGDPLPGGGLNTLFNVFINLGRNLQAGGPGGAGVPVRAVAVRRRSRPRPAPDRRGQLRRPEA